MIKRNNNKLSSNPKTKQSTYLSLKKKTRFGWAKASSHLIHTAAQEGRCCYYIHFTVEETKRYSDWPLPNHKTKSRKNWAQVGPLENNKHKQAP